jgi:hypothetical protein
MPRPILASILAAGFPPSNDRTLDRGLSATATPWARLLPPARSGYSGSKPSTHFLALIGILTIVPGCIHSFLPDGGAGVIAGLDLDQCGAVIVAMFAWAGATQIAFGTVLLLAGVRSRALVPGVLTLVLFERGRHALNAWVLPSAGVRHRPPEHYAVLVAFPRLLTALALSLRERNGRRRPPGLQG